MIKVVAKGIEAFKKQLEKDQKQFKFATVVALTKTAKRIKDAEIEEMKRVFDRPTRFTLNSLYLKPAKKHNLTATVWLKDFAYKGTAPTDYLTPQIYGGGRKFKKFEWLLQRRGLLPEGTFLAPGSAARLNKNGNITRGQIQKVLSNIGAQFDTYQNSSKGKQYFAGVINGTYGIWLRTTTGVKPFMVAVRRPTYKKRLDFFGVANKVTNKYFTIEMKQAVDFAIKTAR